MNDRFPSLYFWTAGATDYFSAAGARTRALVRRSGAHPGGWAKFRRRSTFVCVALCAALGVAAPVDALARERTNAELPAAYRRSPFAVMSLSVGHPNNGWQLRAKKLKASQNLWIQAKSVPYSYGHPALVLMLDRTAKQMARQQPGSVLLVGDLSREFGGPLAGHRSHQSGRDADVGFFVTDSKGKPLNSLQLRAFDAKGRARDGGGLRFDDYRNWLLVQLWLKDDRADLEYVFIASHLRQRLLDFARARPAFRKYVEEAAQFLRQPSNGLPHDDHFHVRIACPEKQRGLCDPKVLRARRPTNPARNLATRGPE